MRFLLTLGRLTATRKKRSPGKEVGIGLVVGVLLGVGTALSPEWAFWVLLLYLASVQAVALAENDVFCDFHDFRRLGFREPSLRYRLAYMVHYVTRDMYLANGIALVLSGGIMVATGNPWFALLLGALTLANLALVPSHVYLASRMSERWRLAYMSALITAVVALVVPLVLGFRVPVGLLPVLAPGAFAVTAIHALAVDRVAGNLRGTGLSSFGGRRWFAWLTPHAPHLFKDLVLFHGLALQALLMGLALFALLMMGSPAEWAGGLALVAICHDNLFGARRERAYRLVSEDTLFHGDRLPLDRLRLRRTKLTTMALDVPVKLAILVGFLVALGQFRWDHFAALFAVLVTILVVDAPLPHLNRPFAVALRYVVNYTAIITYVVVTSFGQPLALVLLHCFVMVGLYAPTLVCTYLRPRPDGELVTTWPPAATAAT